MNDLKGLPMSNAIQAGKRKFGHMNCPEPECGNRVVVKVNGNETLSYSCQECDAHDYCKKGESRYGGWLKRITRLATDEPKKEATKDAPAAPAEKKKPSFFTI